MVSFRGALLTRRNYIKNNLGYYFFFFSFTLSKKNEFRTESRSRKEGSRLRNLNKSAVFVSLFVFVERYSMYYYILVFIRDG